MSRPIAYNASGPLSGSIRGGNVNYTVDSGNRDYTTFASKKWVPSADGAAPIVFVTDTYTQGFELNPSLAVPLFYSCNGTGSAAILYTANRIPNSPGNYSDANVALNDLINARGYFVLESNDPFEGVDADSLALDLDASKMSSYPQTSTSWYDLSGNGFSTTLVNGPTFQTGGWFNLDGTDDRIQRTSNILTTSTGTVVMWLRTTDQTWLMIEGNTTGYYLGAIYLGGAWYNNACGSPSYYVDTKSSTNPTSEGYIDGRFHMFEAKNVDLSGWTTHKFLDYGGGSTFNMTGDVAKIQMYSRNLTAAESKQNYFGSPIVTDGLVFAVDANNTVSYPKSGTSTYNLTGSGATGTLTNGTSFNISNGGSFMFDGTNDYISFPNDTNLDSQAITMESWSNISTLFQNGFLFEKGQVNSQYSNFFNSDGTFYFRTMGLSSEDLTFYAPSYISPNTWNHIVCTYGAGIKTIYINGIQVSQQTGITGTIPTDTTGLFLGAYGPGSSYFLNGKIANSKVYNRALTAAEVLQNYQAEQYRFEGPQGIVTNGLTLWLDAGNLESYPGTGTTWYDLSGNNNNGTLKSTTQWSNLGWMNYDGNNTDTETTVATVEINTNSAQGNTVEQWIYGAALNGNGNMPFTWLDYDFDLWWYNNLFGINNGASLVYGISGANSILLNNWVHVVAYFPYDWAGSYTNAKFWINGIAQSMAIVQGSLVNKTLPSSLNVGIGGGYTSGGDAFNWNGRISQTRIYTRELTTTEVQQNYNATKGRFGL